ncbi:hypothetical protein C0991_008656 [Blastosporella zonata]|nr:hypothetical protein C0991_008656 [Blastosporella zonata]
MFESCSISRSLVKAKMMTKKTLSRTGGKQSIILDTNKLYFAYHGPWLGGSMMMQRDQFVAKNTEIPSPSPTMQSLAAVIAVIALAVPVFAAPFAIEKFSGETTGKYIVKLKDGVSKASVLAALNSNITHDWNLMNGFAGHFSDDALGALRASPDVETNAPWGLSRISQAAKLTNQDTSALTYTYTFDTSPGRGVDIYIVDTGVFTAHTTLGDRARWGATFGGYPSADGNGHGTHVAGTAAGSQYGIAKAASIIAVKVLGDDGSGSVADIISGLNFVATSASSSGRPSVASMSLGGGTSTSLDNAVTSLVNAGIHVTVAAGNSNADAANSSPARVTAAVTVGASTIADARASFSNFGSVVDVFAPGQNVISSWIGSTTATNNISGTSMVTVS